MLPLLLLTLLADAPAAAGADPGPARPAAAGPRPRYPLETPAGAYWLAQQDLEKNVPPGVRDRTRYLSLYAVPADDRAHFLETLSFWVHSLTYRRERPPLPVVGDGLLVRLNLYDCEWDAVSRAEKKAQFAASGVTFAPGEVSDDPWETLAKKDPYFRFPTETERGWIDPGVAYAVYRATGSTRAVLRADWFLANTATDRPDGLYSDFLMIPSQEADLYKSLLIDEKDIKLRALTVGGAVKAGVSVVAREPRELELLRGPYGDLWRTYDFSLKKVIGDDRGQRNVRRSLRGSAVHDGREIIWELPSGLSAYFAANGQGKQVADVPPDIAMDQRGRVGGADRDERVRERTVVNAWKCVDCHGRESGYINFACVVTAQMRHAPHSRLESRGKDAHAVEKEKRANEDYYNEHYLPRVEAEKAAYAAAVFRNNGLDAATNARQFVQFLHRYRYEPVGRAEAAREFGVDPAAVRQFLLDSHDDDLIFLVDDEPVTRPQFETAFGNGMRYAPQYPWETKVWEAKPKPKDSVQ